MFCNEQVHCQIKALLSVRPCKQCISLFYSSLFILSRDSRVRRVGYNNLPLLYVGFHPTVCFTWQRVQLFHICIIDCFRIWEKNLRNLKVGMQSSSRKKQYLQCSFIRTGNLSQHTTSHHDYALEGYRVRVRTFPGTTARLAATVLFLLLIKARLHCFLPRTPTLSTPNWQPDGTDLR